METHVQNFKKIRSTRPSKRQSASGTIEVPADIPNVEEMQTELKTNQIPAGDINWKDVDQKEQIEEYLVD